jgi:GNAT superfamily N-acetyltransferase
MTDACGTLATLAALHRLRVIRCTGATLSPTERYAALGLVEDSHRHVLRKSAGQAYVAAQGMRPELESASTAIVALFRGERLVGFVAHRCSNEETLHVRYLLELHLLERFRRRGLGRALVEEARAVGEQAGACGIMLTCDARNRPAMQFYAEIGFVMSPCSPSVLLTRQATERMRDEDGNEHELLVLLWGEGSFAPVRPPQTFNAWLSPSEASDRRLRSRYHKVTVQRWTRRARDKQVTDLEGGSGRAVRRRVRRPH